MSYKLSKSLYDRVVMRELLQAELKSKLKENPRETEFESVIKGHKCKFEKKRNDYWRVYYHRVVAGGAQGLFAIIRE